MICPYKVDVPNNGNLDLFIIQNSMIALYDYEYDSYKIYGSNEFVIPNEARPATRKEIKEAGLWDYVINKEDYSSEQDKLETKLEEYLRLGENIENSGR